MIKPELLIKINADLKDFNDKMDQVKKKTEELSDGLNKVGVIAGVSFAGLTAVTLKSVDAYKSAKQASNQLEQSLKSQGIFSEALIKNYKSMASELQTLVAVDDDLIISGQAVLQRFIGQEKITKELTMAVVDFAQANKMDLESAFQIVGKTIGTKMNPLARQYGIELSENLTVSEKMAEVTRKLNERFGGQAQAVADAKGPLEALKISFGELQENLGEKLAPSLETFVSGLNSVLNLVSENENAMKILAGVIAGGLGFSALALTVVGITQAFIALNATAVALGVTLTALTGGLFAVVAGAGALIALIATSDKQVKFKNTEQATERLMNLKKRMNELETQKKQGLAVDPELQVLKLKIKDTEKQIGLLKEKEKVEKENQANVAERNKQNAEADAKKKKASEDEKELLKERKALSKELIDAGKDEFQKLEDLRLRRLKLAGNDKDLRLQIEQDYQDKKLKLEKETDEKIRDLREAQAQYEKKLREDNLRAFNESVSNPLKALTEIGGKSGQDQLNTAVGAGAGILNNVSQGAQGAKNLVVEGGALGLDALGASFGIPALGQALKPLIGALTGGPDAVKAFVREFTNAIPDLIQGLIEAIPVLIEELSNQIPVIVERLAERAPDIIQALVRAMPKVGTALALQMPRVAMALIKEAPNMAVGFIEALIKEAPRFVTELIKSLGKGATGVLGDAGGIVGDIVGGVTDVVGGIIGGIGDVFGFAQGGQYFAKSVPSGFPNDSFPARLQSGELVVDQSTSAGLREFINRENSGGGGDNVTNALLNRILNAVTQPINVETSVNLNQKAFADVILQLNRQNARLN